MGLGVWLGSGLILQYLQYGAGGVVCMCASQRGGRGRGGDVINSHGRREGGGQMSYSTSNVTAECGRTGRRVALQGPVGLDGGGDDTAQAAWLGERKERPDVARGGNLSSKSGEFMKEKIKKDGKTRNLAVRHPQETTRGDRGGSVHVFL